MKTYAVFTLLILYSALGHCQTGITVADEQIAVGNFSAAAATIYQKLASGTLSAAEEYNLKFQLDLFRRIRLDFAKRKNDIYPRLQKYFGASLDSLLPFWERSGKLENRIIDGETAYFNRAVSNLFLLDSYAATVKEAADGKSPDKLDVFLSSEIPSVCSNPFASGSLAWVKPLQVAIKYTLTVKPDAVPPGTVLRAWLPYPMQGNPRQDKISFISANTANPVFSGNASAHSSVYMERTAQAGVPTEFAVAYRYIACSVIADKTLLPTITCTGNKAVLAEYTAERPPHITFSNSLQELSATVVGKETTMWGKLKNIFTWVSGNIPWAGALEYSTIPSIPEYCLATRHGDCGIQTLLFINLCRLNGIPARWQSGWMLHPGSLNLHDWCEVYTDQFGWIPVDQSFGVQKNAGPENSLFFLGNTDNYHFIVNSDYGAPLYPAKIYPRSETVDFQRGEVEWYGGNLYFDSWNYDLSVTFGPENE